MECRGHSGDPEEVSIISDTQPTEEGNPAIPKIMIHDCSVLEHDQRDSSQERFYSLPNSADQSSDGSIESTPRLKGKGHLESYNGARGPQHDPEQGRLLRKPHVRSLPHNQSSNMPRPCSGRRHCSLSDLLRRWFLRCQRQIMNLFRRRN